MAPLASHAAARVLNAGAEKLGIRTMRPRLLLNGAPRDGRGACIECGSCVGFPCPSDAKNGTGNTVIRRATASGRCDLVTAVMVASVDTGDRAKIAGVTTIALGGEHRTSRAKAVVLACGAPASLSRLGDFSGVAG
jgi:hypothetical protein